MKREKRRREALATRKKSNQEYISIDDSDSPILEDLDNQAQLRVPAPSSSQSTNFAEHRHPFIRKGGTEPPENVTEPSSSFKLVSQEPIVVSENQQPFIRMGRTRSPQKQSRIVDFWARPSTSPAGTTIMVDAPGESISIPSTPPDARDESPSLKMEKFPEAPM